MGPSEDSCCFQNTSEKQEPTLGKNRSVARLLRKYFTVSFNLLFDDFIIVKLWKAINSNISLSEIKSHCISFVLNPKSIVLKIDLRSFLS